MPWREFGDIADASIDPVPSSVREQADDARYSGDFATLVAIFRTNIDGQNQHLAPNVRFAGQLKHLAHLMLYGCGSSDAQFPQQCFDDWGPAILLRAMAKAHEQPAHELGELEGD